MTRTATHNETDALLHACTQVQELLASCGIASVRYSPTGQQQPCFVEGQAPFHSRLPECAHCRDDALARHHQDDWQALTEPQAWTCPAGHLMLLTPVRHRREPAGILFCCLASLQYEKTEALQRLCSQAGLDTDAFINQGLRDAVSGPKLARYIVELVTQGDFQENWKDIV